MEATISMIHGQVARGFEPVRDAFWCNFTERGEIGAACVVYQDGKCVVDLWGGVRDDLFGLPWEHDTLILVFSATKGIAMMALAHAHSRHLFDFDDPVAWYWEDFAQNGKSDITIRQLLSHQAGLCGVDHPLDYDTLSDPNRLAQALARQSPAWTPGTKQGYHALTLGLYASILLRQIDPQSRTLGQYFHDEIAKPLDIEFYIGLPDTIQSSRLATLKGYKPWQMLLNLNKTSSKFVWSLLNGKSLTNRAFTAIDFVKDIDSYNEPSLQRIELPSANGIGTVKSMAKAYSEFATRGRQLDLKQQTLDALMQPTNVMFDEVLRVEACFSLGYSKPSRHLSFGSSDRAFGAMGTGGSFAFADPDKRLGYAYAMNKCGFYLKDDPREKALRDAVYRCL